MWPRSKTGDRFIWSRSETNFQYLNFERALEDNFFLSKEDFLNNARRKKNIEAYKKIFNLPIGPRKKASDEKKATKPLCFEAENRKPMTMELVSFGHTGIISDKSIDGLRGACFAFAESGRLIFYYNILLQYTNDFITDDRHFQPLSQIWSKPPWHFTCYVTALWQHPSGKGVLAALRCAHDKSAVQAYPCKIGTVVKLEECDYINLSKSYWCLRNEKQNCHVIAIEVNATRPIVYFSCVTHGLVSYHERLDGAYDIKASPSWNEGSKRNFFITMKASPNGAFLAASAHTGGVVVFNAMTMEVAHKLTMDTRVFKAFDWHPSEANLLVTGEWEKRGELRLWRCQQQNPLVRVIDSIAGAFNTPIVRFHPYTGELVVAAYSQAEGHTFQMGFTVIFVLNGDGELVDVETMVGGLVTQMFFGNEGTELVSTIGNCIGRFSFTSKPKVKKPHPYIRRSAYGLLFDP